jgi:tetratricopeptide (TPR) repeat protein/predicted Ser/Thr protein kinase
MPVDTRTETTFAPADELSATFAASSPPPAVEPAPAPGRVVGRYVVLSLLGAGGMGAVYAAYDPELDRKIALKLLRPDAVSVDSARLLREARALAKLAHPNVVSVFDVGTVDAGVFIAMEFVDGVTVTEWLQQKNRRVHDILDLFAAAGRGLAAAHQASVIHRDFKPDNMMVGHDGRVRVLDFGLARRVHDPQVTGVPRDDPRDPGDLALTREGALLGTPAYMAPEQWHGEVAEARTDQFSFCVALWEALYGERPFRGGTTMALMNSVTRGQIQPPTRNDRRVPTWVRRALERGLSLSPADRYPTMDALLAALAHHGRRRRQWLVAGLAALALAGGGALGLRARRVAACEAAGAAVTSVWNAAAEQTLRDTLAATQINYAETTLQKLLPRLEQWTRNWSRTRERLCLDAEVDGTLTPEFADLATTCLEEQLDELSALLAALAGSARADVPRWIPAVAGLPDPSQCADWTALKRRPALPAEPAARTRFVELRHDLSAVHALLAAGRHAEGLARAETLLAAAEELGHRPLAVEARATLAELASNLDDRDRAEREYKRAFVEAGAIGLDDTAANAAVQLVGIIGADDERPAEGRQWSQPADMLVRRLGQERGLLGARLLSREAAVARAQGHYDDALAFYRRALAIREELLGPEHPDVAGTYNNLAAVQRNLGAYDDALATHRRALAIQREALGPDHPELAATYNTLALLEQARGDYEQAQSLLEQALAIGRPAFGDDDLQVATFLNNLGRVHHVRGDYEQAQSLLEQALAIRETKLGKADLDVAITLQNLGLLHMVRGDRLAARALFERVLAIRERQLPEDHPELVNILDSLGTVLFRLGDYDRARELHRRVLATQERRLGPDHPNVGNSLRNLALVEHALGDTAGARALAERALAIGERSLGPDHPDVAALLNTLATIDRRRDPAAAEAMLARALAISLASKGPRHPATATSLHKLGELLLGRGAIDESEARLREALAIREALGPDVPEVADVLAALGDLELARGRPAAAIPLLERALQIRGQAGIPARQLAEVRFALARALRDAPAGHGRDVPRARRLAELAADGLRTAGPAAKGDLAAVEAWLRQ